MRILNTFAYLFWNPSREVVSIPLPLLNRPILWYGVFFALGVFLAYLIFCDRVRKMGLSKQETKKVVDRTLLYVLLGLILGARGFDVLFYQSWQEHLERPWDIIKFWEGGLASHGAAIGAILALYLMTRRHKRPSFLQLLDPICTVAPLAGAFIRIGNFINQEILGKQSALPWAVIFGHPAGGESVVPRHPVQLYEALYYFLLFFVLYGYSRKKRLPGRTSGLFFVLVFSFRFFIEFLKEEQSALMPLGFPLTMGQLLSLPLIAIGFYLLKRAFKGAV